MNAHYHYIKDHIGNNCAVVNSVTNEVVQNVIYFASGVPIPVPDNIEEQPYLYNGKEFVEAHGLNEYDSQARMYYAPIMRTTTMDPLAEKYYHISPYAWCGNNPVNAVDPFGCDTFNIQPDNNVTSISSEDQDVVRFVNENGNVRMVDGVVLEKSFGEKGTIQLIDNKESKEKQLGYVIFSANGDKAGTELFEFLATSGAQKEWSHLKTGADESGTNYIGTDWKSRTTTIAYRIKTQYLTPGVDILREQIHNHPIGGILLPSGTHPKLVDGVWMDAGTWGDMGTKNETIKKWGNSVIFKIYGLDVNTGEYIYVTY